MKISTKTTNITLLALASLMFYSCASRRKILDATVLSMTQSNIKEGSRLDDAGEVKGKFCSNNSKDKGSIGLIDEAVKALQSNNQVDYVQNAVIWQEASCVEVEGRGMRIVEKSKQPRSQL
jgi:hypothetical protein